MIKFLMNLFKIGNDKNIISLNRYRKSANNTRKFFRKELTYTYKNEDNQIITKTIKDVEIIIKETSYGKSCGVICSDNLEKEEIMAIIRMFA